MNIKYGSKTSLLLLGVVTGLAFSVAMTSVHAGGTGKAILIFIFSTCLFQLITRLARPVSEQRVAVHGGVNPKLFRMSLSGLSKRRIIAGCCGPIILGLGTGVSASAGFGAFGVAILLDGIHQTFGVPFWLSQFLLTVMCYLAAWRWARIPLGVGTIPALFLIGPAISLSAAITPDNLGFVGNLMAFIFGTLVFSFGIAISAAAALGPDGKTALSLAAERSSHWPIPHSAFFFNSTAILIGVTLAGNFGVATLLNLVLVPVLLNYLIPPMRQILSEQTHTTAVENTI